MRRPYAFTAKDASKTGNRKRLTSTGNRKMKNGLTKHGIGNEVSDRPRVPGFVPSFIFPFPDTLGTPFPVPVLVTSIPANGSTLNYLYLVIYLLSAPDEFSPITCHCKPSQKQFGFQYDRSLFFRVSAFADLCAFGS